MSLSRLGLSALLCVWTTVACFGQATAGTGSISGTATDATGAVLAGAKVEIVNESKGVRRDLATNDSGVFNAPSLVPAAGYTVTVTKEGFSSWVAKNVSIQVGQNVNLNAQLQVTTAAQSVEVSATAPLVDQTKQGNSQVVGQQQIDNLPINGRRVDSFVLLTPAVVPDGTFGLVSFRGIAGGNSFLTDGNDTTNQFYNENAGRTRISSQISQDAVQEFQVLSNGYSAEYGRALGGVINTVTRSGGNELHGTGYWFFRNQDFNARDRYATINPQEKRNQFGGTVGGPIKKDKLFYFFNTELTRRDFPALNRIVNTNLTDTAGNYNPALCATTGATGATAAQCEAARAYIFRNADRLIPRQANSELLFGKIDYNLNARNTLSFSANYLRWLSPNGIQTQAVLTNNNAASNNADSTVNTRYGRAAWTSILSNTAVNEFRFGWFKDRLEDPASASLIPAQTGALGITVGGVPVGAAIDYPRLNPSEQRFSFANNLSWTVGSHSLKFGLDIANTQDYLKILRNQFGSYSYGSLTAFARDFTGNTPTGRNYQNFTQSFGNRVLDFTTRDYAFFVQDQWRATQKLTINAGLRYEYAQLPQPSITNPDYPQTGRINSPGTNLAPRIGISYALNDKTVIRAGGGIFYARFQGALIQNFFLNNGVYQPQVLIQPNQPGAPVFPNILTSNAGLPSGTVNLQFAAPDFRNPYTLQGDIAIERQLANNLALTVSYVTSRGKQIITARNLNVGLGGPITYRINDLNNNQVGTYTSPVTYLGGAARPDQRYQSIVQVENGGMTYYDGLVTTLNKRFSKGLQFTANYTWSHAIDTANQGGGSNALFFDSVRSTFNGDYSGDKGSSALDLRHRFVTNFFWSPKFVDGNNAFERYFVNGWTLSGILTLQSAQNFTPTVQVTGAPFANAFNNTTLNGLGGSNRVPFLPWNSIDERGARRLDLRLGREFPFTERVRLAANFEAFNVTNSPWNTGIQTLAFRAAGGVLTPVAGLGVGSASQGFPDGTNARRAQFSLRLVF